MGRPWHGAVILSLILGLDDLAAVDAGRGKPHGVRHLAPDSPAAALENAIKLFLSAKGMLAPDDVSEEPSLMHPQRAKHGMMRRPEIVPCGLPEGCVTADAKYRFLLGKYIPGNDNVVGENFKRPGHVFSEREDSQQMNDDFKAYLLSRPKSAVPEVVRKLLLPGAGDIWPGDGERSSFFPKQIDGKYWETDVSPIEGA